MNNRLIKDYIKELKGYNSADLLIEHDNCILNISLLRKNKSDYDNEIKLKAEKERLNLCNKEIFNRMMK